MPYPRYNSYAEGYTYIKHTFINILWECMICNLNNVMIFYPKGKAYPKFTELNSSAKKLIFRRSLWYRIMSES